MSKKKPEDETLRGAPDFESGDSTKSPSGASPAVARPSSASLRAVAPEVSQGVWRERAYVPRAVLTGDEVISGLETGLRNVLSNANHPAVAFQEVRTAWVPFLRQALEQTGGDGIDAWLTRVLRPPGRRAMDPLFDDLLAQLRRLRSSRELAQFEEEALKASELVRKAFAREQPRRLSFKQMELELEGKLEIDDLLLAGCCDDNELTHRLAEIGKTMEQLRDQIRTLPGSKPAGMFGNFTRLKAEMRVLDGEIKRRGLKA